MKRFVYLGVFLLLALGVFAHGESESVRHIPEYMDSAVSVMWSCATAIVVLLTFAMLSGKNKMFYFISVCILTLIATVYLVSATVFLNITSETGGPVHWHADFEIWNCGAEVDLIDPTGLSNRVGNPVFHEHGDNRIHVEGVVVDSSSVDIHNFFTVVGGELTSTHLVVPTNEGLVFMKNGDSCNGGVGSVQVFAYKEGSKVAEKVSGDYVLSGHSQVPPGDCIIVEFDVEKETTTRICSSYGDSDGS